MGKKHVEAALALDWREHTSSLPKEGVLYPKGQDRTELVDRMRKAFSKTKVRQVVGFG